MPNPSRRPIMDKSRPFDEKSFEDVRPNLDKDIWKSLSTSIGTGKTATAMKSLTTSAGDASAAMKAFRDEMLGSFSAGGGDHSVDAIRTIYGGYRGHGKSWATGTIAPPLPPPSPFPPSRFDVRGLKVIDEVAPIPEYSLTEPSNPPETAKPTISESSTLPAWGDY